MKRSSHNPSPEQNPQFTVLNDMVARYIATLGMLKETTERANIDALTGLSNRAALEEAYYGLQSSGLGVRGSDAKRSEKADEHSLLVLDIDYFKDINDLRGGHGAGDRILREVADAIGGRARKRDLATRYGGDEFAVLLPRTTTEQAMKVAEEMRQRVEDSTDVTLSVGVTGVDIRGSFEENFEKADRAMYDAKELGRNQVAEYRPSLYRD